jgi:hypothetical protein
MYWNMKEVWGREMHRSLKYEQANWVRMVSIGNLESVRFKKCRKRKMPPT